MPAPSPWYAEPTGVQRRILDLTARGYTIPEIGHRLHLTRTGVNWHLERLRRTWRLQTNRQLLILAGQKCWATVPNREGAQPRPQQIGRLPRQKSTQERHPWKGTR